MARGRILWAKSEIYGNPVYIWKSTNPKWAHKLDAYTRERRGGSAHDITITAKVFDRTDFDETLLHEFIHVVEHYHTCKELSSYRRGGCTALARVMGHGLAKLLRNLKQVEVEKPNEP